MNTRHPTSYVDLSPEARVNFAFLNWLNCGDGRTPYEILVLEGAERKTAYHTLCAAFKAGSDFSTPKQP